MAEKETVERALAQPGTPDMLLFVYLDPPNRVMTRRQPILVQKALARPEPHALIVCLDPPFCVMTHQTILSQKMEPHSAVAVVAVGTDPA